ncbi:MAG: AAA family ATPase [Deltaproteobacteria bacterium]|nr:AAA family ATPase [Deltaproteobacteria bacterium]
MTCTACGHSNPAGSRFCLACGSAQASRCPHCGVELPADARFCNECGAAIASSDKLKAQSQTLTPSPLSYTPKHLADKILQSKSALEGERKQVTVLFADVKGSMELAEQLDPEEWHGMLERFFEILTEGVHRLEGTVNQYTGDGIMALFGAPIAHEDHAQRACYAALHLLEEVRGYSREVKRSHGLDFAVRIGLHTGDVVVGKIGDDLRMDYTAQGHTVGLAQRMESLAEANTCFVSYATAALASGYVAFDDLGPFRVKGVAEPVNVFVLRGLGAVRTRFDASRARGLTRFVGRDDDMRTLEAALAQAQAGHGQVVGLVAEAGTGKSRLCFEFVQHCRARGMAVNEAQAVAHGKNVPLLPILQVLRAYHRIGERDDDRTVREKIAGRLLLIDDGFREVLPVIFDFYGVPDPERPVPRMDPEARQRLYFAVLRKVVQRDDPSGRPPVTLIEDLHWMDPASEAFLAEWVEAIGAAGRLLVVNFRPEYRAAWMQKSYYRQIALTPLGPEAIRELLSDLLGSDESTTGLADMIHARSGGNPFFAEEIVQTLIESGSLQGSRGSYRLTTPVARLDVPPSVRGLLGARIDRLEERDKQVLQTAAVIGKEFSEPILRQVLAATAGDALPEAQLGEALATLRSREFVHETALYPIAEYSFKHPLTQEVALGSQLQERRRQIHAAVAQAIEATHADKLDEHAALLAHHCVEAGQPLAAAQWHARAATFLARSDVTESARHRQQAREALRTVADDPRAPALGADACFHVLGLAFRLGVPELEAHSVFREGLDWAARTDDPLWAGRLHQAMSVFESGNNRFDAGLRHSVEWERIVRALPDEERRACALWPTLMPLLGKGDLAALRINCQQQLAWTEGHPEWGLRDWGVSALADVLNNLAWGELRDGTFEQARALIERSIDVARGLDSEVEVWSLGVLGDLGFLAGDPDLARSTVERAVRISEPLGVLARTIAHSRLGRQLLLDGRVAEAAEALEYAQSFSKDGNRSQAPFIAHALAQARLAAGEPARARDGRSRAGAVSRDQRSPPRDRCRAGAVGRVAR